MKKKMKLAAIAAFVLSFTAWADTENSGGITWTYGACEGGVEILGAGNTPSIPKATSGSITVPKTLGGKNVVRVGFRAFYNCSNLKSVTIQSGVTEIGLAAFAGCTSLESVTIPDSVANIGDMAFLGCESMADADGFVIVRGVLHYYAADDDEVTIPNGVTRIGSYAFEGCNMDVVTMPASMTSIGDSAFKNCCYLETVNMPDGVTSIGEEAFWGCYYLSDDDGFVIVRNMLFYYTEDAGSLTIPGGVETIFGRAFYNCDDLVSVTIPASTTSIGANAFNNCGSLKEAWIPKGVTKIGNRAFFNSPLKTVHVEAGDTARVRDLLSGSGQDVGGITFKDDMLDSVVVVFDANGGSLSPATRRVTRGATIGNLPVPVRAGYMLNGWFTAPAGGEEISSALVVNADATYYARWTEITAATWFTKRADAFAEARRTGKRVFMICGRDTCGNTMYTKNTSCANSTVKSKLVAKCVLWYSNCDTQQDENRFYWPTGTFALPVVCVIDPRNERGSLVRATGPQTASQIIAMLEKVPYPDAGPDAIDPLNPGELPWYQVLNARDIWAPYSAPKAVTLLGVAYDRGDLVGVVELKLGKVSKGMTSKISGSVTLLNGKKHSIKAQTVDVNREFAISVNLGVRGLDDLRLAVGGSQFAGALGSWHVQSANVGGNWSKASATATVEAGNVSMFPGVVLEGLLPTNEVAVVSRGKWAFAKAASVKWTKPKAGQAAVMQDASGKGLVVDTAKGKTNLSGLKLTYTPKKGTFKGSFKVYAMQGTKLKKYTVKVSGVVVDGVGDGVATSTRPAVSWPVTVE